jgi:hypothetical protein
MGPRTRLGRARVWRGRLGVAAWVRVACLLGGGGLGAGLLVPVAAAPAEAAVLTGAAGLVSGVSQELVSESSTASVVGSAVVRVHSSPAAALVSGGTEVVFTDPDGWLEQVDPGGARHRSGDGFLAVRYMTSPSVSAQWAGSQLWEAAFQSAGQDLWTLDSHGSERDSGQEMALGSGPAIAGVGSAGYEIAFAGMDGHLWTIGPSGQAHQTSVGVAPGTSPAIAASGGGWKIAFQASGDSGHLWTLDSAGQVTNTGLVMAPGSSPSINSNYQIAYAGADGYLQVRDTDGTVRTPQTTLAVAPGTSPSITASGSGWQAAYQAAVEGTMWTASSNPLLGLVDTGIAMTDGTSPSLSAFINDSRECQVISCTGDSGAGGPVAIIRPAYDPVHCQNHLIDCQLADVNGDHAPDAIGIVDHDDTNFGWQGGIIVALGNPNATAPDGSDLFATPALWGGTGCDTPGDTCVYNGALRSIVQFVTSPVTSPELRGATQGSVVAYHTDGTRFTPWHTVDVTSPCQAGYFCGVGSFTTSAFPGAIAINPATGAATVALGNAGGGFGTTFSWGTTVCTTGLHCAVTDVNNDGNSDITATNPTTGDVLLSDGTPSAFQPGGGISGQCPHPVVCAFIDVNNDGLDDLVARNPADTTITPSQAWASTQTSPGTFTSPTLTDLQTDLLPPTPPTSQITPQEPRQLTPHECDAIHSGIKANMTAANYFGDLAEPGGPEPAAYGQEWAHLYFILEQAALDLVETYSAGGCPDDPDILVTD